MSLYTERWRARPAWRALSISERIAYLDGLDEDLRALTEAGARLVGLALREGRSSDHGGPCRYVAVWRMPEGEALERRLEAVLAEAGWHRYFEWIGSPDRVRSAVGPASALNGNGTR